MRNRDIDHMTLNDQWNRCWKIIEYNPMDDNKSINKFQSDSIKELWRNNTNCIE